MLRQLASRSAIRIDPKITGPYTVRGIAWAAKGDLDRAIADYDQAIRIDPKNSSWYFHRGLGNLYAGALPTALADLDKASELNPKHAYAALWLDIVNKRSNLPSRLAEAAKQIRDERDRRSEQHNREGREFHRISCGQINR